MCRAEMTHPHRNDLENKIMNKVQQTIDRLKKDLSELELLISDPDKGFEQDDWSIRIQHPIAGHRITIPWRYQQELLKLSESKKHTLVLSKRQSGTSTILPLLAAKILDDNRKAIYMSPNYSGKRTVEYNLGLNGRTDKKYTSMIDHTPSLKKYHTARTTDTVFILDCFGTLPYASNDEFSDNIGSLIVRGGCQFIIHCDEDTFTEGSLFHSLWYSENFENLDLRPICR